MHSSQNASSGSRSNSSRQPIIAILTRTVGHGEEAYTCDSLLFRKPVPGRGDHRAWSSFIIVRCWITSYVRHGSSTRGVCKVIYQAYALIILLLTDIHVLHAVHFLFINMQTEYKWHWWGKKIVHVAENCMFRFFLLLCKHAVLQLIQCAGMVFHWWQSLVT